MEGPTFVNRFRESQSECIGSLGNGVKKICAIFRATLELNRQRWELQMGGAKKPMSIRFEEKQVV